VFNKTKFNEQVLQIFSFIFFVAIPTLTASVLGGRADHLAGYLEFENCGTEPVNSTDGKVK